MKDINDIASILSAVDEINLKTSRKNPTPKASTHNYIPKPNQNLSLPADVDKLIVEAEDYKKKINTLRTEVSSLKKDRNSILETVSKKRRKARNTLLQELNPIIKSYMIEKKIKIVLDKKNILLADEELDITNDVVNLLNEKLKSISLN